MLDNHCMAISPTAPKGSYEAGGNLLITAKADVRERLDLKQRPARQRAWSNHLNNLLTWHHQLKVQPQGIHSSARLLCTRSCNVQGSVQCASYQRANAHILARGASDYLTLSQCAGGGQDGPPMCCGTPCTSSRQHPRRCGKGTQPARARVHVSTAVASLVYTQL
jgi:hypothetical protein